MSWAVLLLAGGSAAANETAGDVPDALYREELEQDVENALADLVAIPIGAVLHQLLHFAERTPDDPTWKVTFTIDLLFDRREKRQAEAR